MMHQVHIVDFVGSSAFDHSTHVKLSFPTDKARIACLSYENQVLQCIKMGMSLFLISSLLYPQSWEQKNYLLKSKRNCTIENLTCNVCYEINQIIVNKKQEKEKNYILTIPSHQILKLLQMILGWPLWTVLIWFAVTANLRVVYKDLRKEWAHTLIASSCSIFTTHVACIVSLWDFHLYSILNCVWSTFVSVRLSMKSNPCPNLKIHFLATFRFHISPSPRSRYALQIELMKRLVALHKRDSLFTFRNMEVSHPLLSGVLSSCWGSIMYTYDQRILSCLFCLACVPYRFWSKSNCSWSSVQAQCFWTFPIPVEAIRSKVLDWCFYHLQNTARNVSFNQLSA